jgi:FSR family fosmidomycin resistance protein-like MFS transporter
MDKIWPVACATQDSANSGPPVLFCYESVMHGPSELNSPDTEHHSTASQDSAATSASPSPRTGGFEAGRVSTFAFAHGVHDTYASFFAPLLPSLIDKLSLSMTGAGLLDFLRTIPSLLQPFIGHLGDRVNLRWLVILAPAITGTMMSLLGIAPSYAVLIMLALVAGLGSAALHAVAPAMAGRVSGAKLGWGMGLWMVGGSIGYAVGPVIIVAVVSHVGLQGTPWLMLGGWMASALLLVRLRDTSTLSPAQPRVSLREGFTAIRPLVAPLVTIIAVWALQVSARMTFLPTFLTQEGESLWFAGIALTVQTGVGWIGALLGGAISDRLGRRVVIFASMASAAVLMFIFLSIAGWVRLLVLMLIGITGPATRAVLMALVQESCPNNRAMANGMLLAISFVLESGSSIVMGALGDLFGLRTAFTLSAVILLLGSPLVRLLPASSPTAPTDAPLG